MKNMSPPGWWWNALWTLHDTLLHDDVALNRRLRLLGK
jgi:hypothetical protein